MNLLTDFRSNAAAEGQSRLMSSRIATERRSEYEHLVPLHARYSVLPQGQADRERFRLN